MLLNVLSLYSALLPLIILGWQFYLVNENGEKAIESGFLIAENTNSYNKNGTVCDDEFSDASAAVICKEMGYIGSKSWSSENKWSVQSSYDIVLDDIRCHDSNRRFDDCSYRDEHNCGHSEDVFLNCKGCTKNHYQKNASCVKCPKDSTSEPNSIICNCTAGKYWNSETEACPKCPANTYSRSNSTGCTGCPENSLSRKGAAECDCYRGFFKPAGREECWKCPPDITSTRGSTFCECAPGLYFSQGYCKTCRENTFSPGNTTHCEPCPPGSSSRPGVEHCDCSGGLYMNSSENCLPCEGDSYSYEGGTTCTPCPGNYTSAIYQSYCECPVGLYWNFTLSNCVECPLNHYNDQTNQTECRGCPENSSSQPGSESCSCKAGYKLLNISHCEVCPENHYSKAGSLNCEPCPHFKAAAPGSEYCYRCTLGQYWENHTCLQCPEHLYGDGVHCLACPYEFQVDQGLCYKVADRKSLANVVEPLEIAVIVLSSVVFLNCIVTVLMMWKINAIINAEPRQG